MGKVMQATVQPQSRKTAVAGKPRVCFKGWQTVVEFLRDPSKERANGLTESSQLIHVITCANLMHGVQAEVNWYTGGNGYVNLPYVISPKKSGVYSARANHIQWNNGPDSGPDEPSASITHLRWLGSRKQFLECAVARGKSDLVKKHLGLLMEMLTVNVDSVSDSDSTEP